MTSKTAIRRTRAATRHVKARMIAEGLDPNKPEDRLEHVKRLQARVTKKSVSDAFYNADATAIIIETILPDGTRQESRVAPQDPTWSSAVMMAGDNQRKDRD